MGQTTFKRRKIPEFTTGAKRTETEPVAGGEDKTNDVFRKFFESRFQPLDLPAQSTIAVASQISDPSNEDGESEEDFDGFSNIASEDEEDEEVVKVVEYVDVPKEDVMLDKQTRKAILSAKVPTTTELSSTTKSANKPNDVEVDNEAVNLQHDLALQRLLSESHLLDPGSSDLNPTGKNRLKAMDLRLQSLGAKRSIFEQNKMPKSHREGIQAKAIKTDTNRRREAKENGIILEKPVFKQRKTNAKRRERGVGAPAVGKFSGGTLKLSKHDLASIQGPSKKGGKGGKGSKRGRR